MSSIEKEILLEVKTILNEDEDGLTPEKIAELNIKTYQKELDRCLKTLESANNTVEIFQKRINDKLAKEEQQPSEELKDLVSRIDSFFQTKEHQELRETLGTPSYTSFADLQKLITNNGLLDFEAWVKSPKVAAKVNKWIEERNKLIDENPAEPGGIMYLDGSKMSNKEFNISSVKASSMYEYTGNRIMLPIVKAAKQKNKFFGMFKKVFQREDNPEILSHGIFKLIIDYLYALSDFIIKKYINSAEVSTISRSLSITKATSSDKQQDIIKKYFKLSDGQYGEFSASIKEINDKIPGRVSFFTNERLLEIEKYALSEVETSNTQQATVELDDEWDYEADSEDWLEESIKRNLHENNQKTIKLKAHLFDIRHKEKIGKELGKFAFLNLYDEKIIEALKKKFLKTESPESNPIEQILFYVNNEGTVDSYKFEDLDPLQKAALEKNTSNDVTTEFLNSGEKFLTLVYWSPSMEDGFDTFTGVTQGFKRVHEKKEKDQERAQRQQEKEQERQQRQQEKDQERQQSDLEKKKQAGQKAYKKALTKILRSYSIWKTYVVGFAFKNPNYTNHVKALFERYLQAEEQHEDPFRLLKILARSFMWEKLRKANKIDNGKEQEWLNSLDGDKKSEIDEIRNSLVLFNKAIDTIKIANLPTGEQAKEENLKIRNDLVLEVFGDLYVDILTSEDPDELGDDSFQTMQESKNKKIAKNLITLVKRELKRKQHG